MKAGSWVRELLFIAAVVAMAAAVAVLIPLDWGWQAARRYPWGNGF